MEDIVDSTALSATIRHRLAEVFADASTYSPLTRAELQRTMRTVLDFCIEQRPDAPDSDGQELVLAAADVDSIGISNWLAHLPVDLDNNVVVIWLGDRSAATMAYRAFVQHYEELWYPGADDVWVYGEKDHWLLEIDHEERFAFKRCSTQRSEQVSGRRG